MHKLSKHVGDEETAVEWPNLFYRQETTGLDRLVIAPRRNPIGLLTELAKYIEPEYYLLYVLVASRGSSLQGRYQSPPLQSVDVRLFLDDFAGLLEHDARHHFWIGSTTTGDLLVYDDHGIIYAYGPLRQFEGVLTARGLTSGAFSIPSPHTHHFHDAFDDDAERLLSRWEWVRSDLQPSD